MFFQPPHNNDAADKALRLISESLDVPNSKYADAERSYKAVGEWLDAQESPLHEFQPIIYPQGSFALGTVIRPPEGGEYDVDAVCLLSRPPRNLSQEALKNLIGARLKEHGTYVEMIDPKEGGRRCWTLRYADGSKFHLDVLPAIPVPRSHAVANFSGDLHSDDAIFITDKTTWRTGSNEWPRSNPKGYRKWFIDRMRTVFNEERVTIAKAKYAQVDDIPEYEVRTPLQRLVQILKRHRDHYYENDDDQPISIILTTLAALAYNNEPNLAHAFSNVVPKLRAHIIANSDGVDWVPNPVHPAENFADKWAETPRKKEIFFEWLDAIEEDCQAIVSTLTPARMTLAEGVLQKAFGEKLASVALGKATSVAQAPTALVKSASVALQGAAHHEFAPWPDRFKSWPTNKRPSIVCRAHRSGFRPKVLRSGEVVSKGVSLEFTVTKSFSDIEYRWQVTNTGAEALMNNCPRGRIFSGARIRPETTSYTGNHYVECHLVRDGERVGHLGPFVVSIR